jgi:hypothetical protein
VSTKTTVPSARSLEPSLWAEEQFLFSSVMVADAQLNQFALSFVREIEKLQYEIETSHQFETEIDLETQQHPSKRGLGTHQSKRGLATQNCIGDQY